MALVLALLLLGLGGLMPASVRAAAPRLAALGDSLTAGWGVAAGDAFPVKLEKALAQKGHPASIANFGVSGDTTSGGLARLEGVLAHKPDGVIVELGANDVLRHLPAQTHRSNLEAILSRLETEGIPVLLCGLRIPESYGTDYAAAIEAAYADLARAHGAVFYPYFLDGVAGHPDRLQPDGLHPNAAGVDVIVAGILPACETLLSRLGAAPPAGAAPTAP